MLEKKSEIIFDSVFKPLSSSLFGRITIELYDLSKTFWVSYSKFLTRYTSRRPRSQQFRSNRKSDTGAICGYNLLVFIMEDKKFNIEEEHRQMYMISVIIFYKHNMKKERNRNN